MKILVTGCGGFIGSHLCERLLKTTQHQILGLDLLNDYYDVNQKLQNLDLLKRYSQFSFFKEDIITTKIIEREQPEIVVHLAAMAGVRYSLENPNLYMRTNVEGHTNLLNQSYQQGVQLFIYASSSSVYGNNTKIPFQETDSIDNLNSVYAMSKYSCELVSQLYHKLYQIPVIGLRFFTVYGPRGRPDMAPFKFLSKIMNGLPIDKYGSGNSIRDYTYVDDIVSGIMGAINNKHNRTCEVYNLGNSHTYTLNEFIDTCQQVTGHTAKINQQEDQKGDVPATSSDIQKAQEDLDYFPTTHLKEGLTKMFEWLQEYQSKPTYIFNSTIDTELIPILTNIQVDELPIKRYFSEPISFEVDQLSQLFGSLNHDHLRVFYNSTLLFDHLNIGQVNENIMIEFEDSSDELMNKGISNILELTLT